MKESMYYRAKPIQLPTQVTCWVGILFHKANYTLLTLLARLKDDYALTLQKDVGFQWTHGEEKVGFFLIILFPIELKHIPSSIW